MVEVEDPRTQLANRRHVGTQISVVRYCMSKLPPAYRDADEIGSEVGFWSAEAADRFDSSRNCVFNTFLTCHLRMRARNYIRKIRDLSCRDAHTGGDNCEMLEEITVGDSDITSSIQEDEFESGLTPEARLILSIVKMRLSELARPRRGQRPLVRLARELGIPKSEFLRSLSEIRSAYRRCM